MTGYVKHIVINLELRNKLLTFLTEQLVLNFDFTMLSRASSRSDTSHRGYWNSVDIGFM